MEMENMRELYERCALVFEGETALLRKISVIQDKIWQDVMNRAWDNIEAGIETVNGFASEFKALEAERQAVAAEFPGSGDEKSRFYAFAARFSPAMRNKLTGLYRNLKEECLKIRISGDTLTGYLNEIRSLVAGYLETAFPERRGRIYSSQGTQVPPPPRSLVLNHHF
jgi:hypothetical protein